MLRNLFGYPVVLAVTAYLGILNRRSWIILLFFAELILFLVQIIAVIYQKMNLFLEVILPQPTLSGDEPALMEISLRNIGVLPVQRLQIRSEYQYLMNGTKKKKRKKREKIKIWGKVDSEDTQSYEIQSGPFPSGQFLISIPYIRIYDYLGIFSVKIKVGKSQMVTILPSFVIMPLVLSGREIPIDSESDSTKKGQDPTEIYDIREYQAGDSLKQIYWKRSAGRELLLYRENAAQKGVVAVLFFQIPEQREFVLFHYELKIAGSFMLSLLQRGYLHFFVWENLEEKCLERRLIENEQNLYEVTMELLSVITEKGKKIKDKRKIEHKKEKQKKRKAKPKKEKQKKAEPKKEKKGKKKQRKAESKKEKDGRRKQKKKEKARGIKKAGHKKEQQQNNRNWQETIHFQYEMQFKGEICPEAFFLIGNTGKKNTLVLEQETEILMEFLKGKKFQGSKQEEQALEEEMKRL